jgi:hypothetical protein
MSQERRVHTRFVVALAAEITAGDAQFTATTKDISVGGCCIASPYPLPEGGTVMCSLYLVVDGIEEAGLAALETQATVRWAADTGEVGTDDRHMAGLDFCGLSEQQRAWLLATIAKTESNE